MVQETNASVEKNPFRVTDPEQISASRYYDPEFFELERKYLWPHVWQMACRLEQIPDVGDYVEYTIFDKSVLIVRTESGVKAFHNACRHRGVQFAEGSGNCKGKGFICPFHGWRWNMDGVNTFVWGRNVFSEKSLQQAQIDLVPCRVELWGGCAFINLDDNAPSLLECLGPVAERMSARNVEGLRMEKWFSTVLPTNWKLAMEAFMEGYHTMRTHPQLHAVLAPETNIYGADANSMTPVRPSSSREVVERTFTMIQRLSDGMGGMIDTSEVAIADSLRTMELPDDAPSAVPAFFKRLREEITVQGRARGLDVPDLNDLAEKYPFSPVEYMFPHYFLLPTFSAMSSYRIRPLTPETCIFELFSLAFLPEDHERLTEPTVLPYDSQDFPEIPQQDYSNLPLQQRGLHAVGFEYMRLSSEVEGLISNYQRLIDGYIDGLEGDALANASRVVNAGFNVPIADIGFGPPIE